MKMALGLTRHVSSQTPAISVPVDVEDQFRESEPGVV